MQLLVHDGEKIEIKIIKTEIEIKIKFSKKRLELKNRTMTFFTCFFFSFDFIYYKMISNRIELIIRILIAI